MAASGTQRRRRPTLDPSFLVFCGALVLSLVRATDMPQLEVTVGSTTVDVTPTDVALLALAVICASGWRDAAACLARRWRRARRGRILRLAAALLGAERADALVAAAKLLEYGVLALGLVLFVRRRDAALDRRRHDRGLRGRRDHLGRARLLRARRRRLHRPAPALVHGRARARHPLDADPVGRAGLLFAPAAPAAAAALAVGGASLQSGIVLGAAVASLLGLYAAVTAIVADGNLARDRHPARARRDR